MANLNTKTISAGVGDILAVDGGLTDASTVKQIKDGEGTGSPFYITTTKVGIGTATPECGLDVESAGVAQVRIGRSNSGTTNELGNLYFGNSTDNFLCGVVGFEDGANDSGMLKFNVEKTGVGISTAMVIKSSGRVGIGATDPGAPLHIDTDPGDTNPIFIIRNNNINSSGKYNTIRFGRDASSHEELQIRYTFDTGDSNQASYASFGLKGNETTLNLSGYGRVGIGTPSPHYALHIKSGHSTDDNTTGGGTLALQGSDSSVSANTDLGAIYFLGSDTTITTPPTVGAKILAESAGEWDNTDSDDAPTNLKFFTCDDDENNSIAERMVIRHDGKVGIGASIPVSQASADVFLEIRKASGIAGLVLNGGSSSRWELTSDTGDDLKFSRNGTARLTADGSTGVVSGDLNDTSDVNRKQKIESLSEGLSIVNQLRPVTFEWKDTKREAQGFIAQEIEKILPHCVTGEDYVDVSSDDDSTPNLGKSINVTGIVANLTKAIQELSAKVTALENK